MTPMYWLKVWREAKQARDMGLTALATEVENKLQTEWGRLTQTDQLLIFRALEKEESDE